MRTKKYTDLKARRHLPSRMKSDNKTRGGKCLIVAGSSGLWGAAVLCAQAAARSGAGYTFIYDFKKSFPSLRFPDFLVSSSKKDLKNFNAVAVGPGFKDRSYLKKFILHLIKIKQKFVVLDAEALNVLALEKKPFLLPNTWILTPHEGEMSRLLHLSSKKIKADRKGSVLKLQKAWGCVVLLKGAQTLIADHHSLYEINSGNSSLAKAGTGDVLTGIITGFLSQGLTSIDAACLAAFVHGKMADFWIQEGKDQLSLLASDLIDQLPQTLSRIRVG